MSQRKSINSDVHFPPIRQLSIISKWMNTTQKAIREEALLVDQAKLLESKAEFLKSRNNDYLKLYEDLKATKDQTKEDPEGTISEVYKELSKHLEDFNGKVNQRVSDKESKLAFMYDIRLEELKNTLEKDRHIALNSIECVSERENNLRVELDLLKTNTEAVHQKNHVLEQHNRKLRIELDTVKTEREGLQKRLFTIKAAEAKTRKPNLNISRNLQNVQIKEKKISKDKETERYLDIIKRLQKLLHKEKSEKNMIKRKCLQVTKTFDSFCEGKFKSYTERSRRS